MRKGDEKRQELLRVAERLFCLKGYEATSVQDILDVLHVSKGGFYHHFASKEALLDTLFLQRAEKMLEQTEALLAGETDEIRRLNLLMYGFLPLRREEADFLAMLMPMLDKPEGRALRLGYQQTLFHTFLPSMRRELALAQDAQVIFPVHDDLGEVVLHLLEQAWVNVSIEIMAGVKRAQKPEAAVLLGILAKYRCSLERLLDAPFGSMELISLQEWDQVVDRLASRLLLPMQG